MVQCNVYQEDTSENESQKVLAVHHVESGGTDFSFVLIVRLQHQINGMLRLVKRD